jgi:hypothetical protein
MRHHIASIDRVEFELDQYGNGELQRIVEGEHARSESDIDRVIAARILTKRHGG